ncbi:hypothetical protein VI817_001832 [Penicillium citrinum]|nr:hypothetical protein VI817_001832 [Penicillium citrinum]
MAIIWPGIDSLLYCPSNGDFGNIAGSIDCATGSSSDQGRILPMEEVDIAPSAFPALSFDEDTMDNQEKPPSHMAQAGRYSFPATGMSYGPDNGLPGTINHLINQMEQFTTTIYHYGTLTHALESKIDTFATSIGQMGSQVGNLVYRLDSMEHRLDSMERRLDSMEHRLDTMEHHIDGMDGKIHDIDGSCKMLNSYLLEVIKREKDFVRDMRDLRDPGDSL